MTWFGRAAALGAAAIVVASCSSSGQTTAQSTAPRTTAAAAAAAAGYPHPCSVLTASEVASAYGSTSTSPPNVVESLPGSGEDALCAVGVGNTNLGVGSPGTAGAGDAAEVRVLWLTPSEFDAADGASAIPVAGVGDRAFYVTTDLLFRKGQVAFRLTADAATADPTWLRKDEVVLARLVVARL
jgi:hypothetical protein